MNKSTSFYYHLAIPDSVLHTIAHLLGQAMDEAVSNGANSISMPDELVELAVWLTNVDDYRRKAFDEAFEKAYNKLLNE